MDLTKNLGLIIQKLAIIIVGLMFGLGYRTIPKIWLVYGLNLFYGTVLFWVINFDINFGLGLDLDLNLIIFTGFDYFFGISLCYLIG